MKKLYIIIALLFAMFATAQPVQVPYSCGAGNAFTIKIPVRLPVGASIEYVWYRNDTVVQTTPLTAGVTAISYTVPADKAYGNAVAFHFKYRVDCDDEWSLSARYLVNFPLCTLPQVSAVVGDTAVCGGMPRLTYSTNYVSGVYYTWTVPAGWRITTGRNTSSITVTADTAGGVISVTPANDCGSGATHTLTVSTLKLNSPGAISFEVLSACEGVGSAGVIGFAADTCADGVNNAGVIDFAPALCNDGISTAGTISFAPY